MKRSVQRAFYLAVLFMAGVVMTACQSQTPATTVPIALPTTVAGSPTPATQTWYISSIPANIYACSATDCEVYAALSFGAPIQVLSTKNEWHAVLMTDGRTGYVPVSITSQTLPAATEAPTDEFSEEPTSEGTVIIPSMPAEITFPPPGEPPPGQSFGTALPPPSMPPITPPPGAGPAVTPGQPRFTPEFNTVVPVKQSPLPGSPPPGAK
jgi:hypothetical protein